MKIQRGNSGVPLCLWTSSVSWKWQWSHICAHGIKCHRPIHKCARACTHPPRNSTLHRHTMLDYLIEIVLQPSDWCGSADWEPACEPKGGQFDPQSGRMPGLWARSPVGGAWEATTHWCFSPSLSPSLPLCLNQLFCFKPVFSLCLKINKIFLKNCLSRSKIQYSLCVYIYLCVCIYIFVCIYTYVCIYTWQYIFVCGCVCVRQNS